MDAISVYSPTFSIYDSYGRIASELSSGLEVNGVYVNEFALDKPGQKLVKMSMGGFVLGYPTNFRQYGVLSSMGPRIAVTMFESTQLPPGWTDVLNKCDHVVVPSEWQYRLFADSGVKTPIHVIKLGVSRAYTYAPREDSDQITFLVIADRGSRKGWQIALEAFYKAFGEDPKYQLIIKTRKWHTANISNQNITILECDYSEEEMAALYQRCDFMLFPSKGEGFGLPPREFAATGGIAFATDWGGTADHLPLWGVPIAAGMEAAWVGFKKLEGLGEWANPSVGNLVARMLQFSALPAHCRNLLGHAFSIQSRELYNWQHFADECFGLWEYALEERYGLHVCN